MLGCVLCRRETRSGSGCGDLADGHRAIPHFEWLGGSSTLFTEDRSRAPMGALIGGQAHLMCQTPYTCVWLNIGGPLDYAVDDKFKMLLPVLDLGDCWCAVGSNCVLVAVQLGCKDTTDSCEVRDRHMTATPIKGDLRHDLPIRG